MNTVRVNSIPNSDVKVVTPGEQTPNIEIRLPAVQDISPSEIRLRYKELTKTPLSPLAANELKIALNECALDASSTPEDLLSIAKRVPALEFLLNQDARIRERYTIEEHTSMFERQLDKYLHSPIEDCILSHAELRIAGLFHDIGKSLPDLKSDQHLGNLQVFNDFDLILPLSDKSKAVIKSLISNNPIGDYIIPTVQTFATSEEREEIIAEAKQKNLSGREIQVFADKVIFLPTSNVHIESAKQVSLEIIERAQSLDVSAKALLNLHILFYGADTAAYTYDSVATNGRRAYPGLDFLFTLNESFDVEPNPDLLSRDELTGLMKFSARVQEKLDLIVIR